MKGFGPERRGSLGEVLRRTITRICRTYWRALAGFLIVGIGQLSIGLYAIVLLQRLLDAIPAARSLSDLARPLALYAGATLLNHLLIYLDGYPRAILSHGAYHWVKAQALRKVATVDYLAYQELSTGRLIERVEQGASATRRVLMNFWLALARNFVPQIAISLILVRRYDAALCAVFVGMVIVLSVLSNVLMRALRRQVERMLAHQESLTRYSVREIVGLVVFRVNSRFSHELCRVRALSDSIIRSQASIRLVQELLFTGFAVLAFAITLVVIVRQAGLIIAGASTIGALVALTSLIKQAVAPISHFSVALTQYRQDRIAFARFAELLSLPDDPGLLQGVPLTIEQSELVLDGA